MSKTGQKSAVTFDDINRSVYEIENVEFGEDHKLYSFRSPNVFALMNAQKICGKSFNDVIRDGDLVDICRFVYAVGPKDLKRDFVSADKWLEYLELYDMATCAKVFGELIKPLVSEDADPLVEETPAE